MNKGRRLWGSIIIAAALILSWSWSSWGRAALFTDKVPVISKDVYQGDTITKDMIDYEPIKINADYISARQIEQYIGMESVQFINKGTPLFKEYFAKADTFPDIRRDKVCVSLSDENVSNSMSNLKKGDTVILYVSNVVVLEARIATYDEKKSEFAVITNTDGALKISEMLSEGRKFLIVRG